MSSPLPSPLLAALGVVPAVLDQVRRLPGRAVRLPVYAVSSALNTVDTVRREYDDLTERGERLVATLRGDTRAADEAGLDVLAEQVPDAAPFSTAHLDAGAAVEATVSNVAPLVSRGHRAAQRAADAVTEVASDAAEAVTEVASDAAGTVAELASDAAGTVAELACDAAGTVADTAGTVADAAGTVAGTAADTASDAAGAALDTASDVAQGLAGAAQQAGTAVKQAADTLETATRAADEQADRVPDAEAPKGAPTPPAPQRAPERVDSAATPSVLDTVEQVVEQVGASRAPEHDELPLPDYDHMTLGSLRGRMRALSVDQLVAIRAYEKVHADRLPVVTMLDNRIAKLSTDPGATPSGPVSTSPAPEQLAAASGPSGAVTPATTTAPVINPPSHGDPTNPAQPRS